MLSQLAQEQRECITFIIPFISQLASPQALLARAFSAITNLYSLDLHDCRISNISLAAFSGLESLRILRLSGNTLTSLPSVQLTGLERLEELSLGSNYIEVNCWSRSGFLELCSIKGPWSFSAPIP